VDSRVVRPSFHALIYEWPTTKVRTPPAKAYACCQGYLVHKVDTTYIVDDQAAGRFRANRRAFADGTPRGGVAPLNKNGIAR
jgi:hypothetical protein